MAGSENQERSDLVKAHEASMTCSKINIAIFLLLDASGILFGFYLLLSHRPDDDEQAILGGLMFTILAFLIAVLPNRIPALYGTQIHRMMVSFLIMRATAIVIAIALIIRFERGLGMLSVWLCFHIGYMIYCITFYVLSKIRKKRKHAVPEIRIEETGDRSNGQTAV
jgi:hypothetical protein